MVYLPVSHSAHIESAPAARLHGFGLRVVEFLHILAAAIRAARALEARQDPHPADLETLGISGHLPRTW